LTSSIGETLVGKVEQASQDIWGRLEWESGQVGSSGMSDFHQGDPDKEYKHRPDQLLRPALYYFSVMASTVNADLHRRSQFSL